MKDSALSREEKERIELALKSVGLIPARGGQVMINLDAQQKISSVEVKLLLR